MKRLVFLTARLPFPASSGRKNVMYNYCKILHETYGYDITVVSYLEEGDNSNAKPDFISNVIVLPNVSAKKKIKNLMVKTFFQRKWPMQVSLFWDPLNAVRIKNCLLYTFAMNVNWRKIWHQLILMEHIYILYLKTYRKFSPQAE